MTNDITWDGKPLCETYGLTLESYEEEPPEPKTSVVSIPGGVDLDLTDALTGHAAFSDRKCKATLFCPGTGTGLTSLASEVTNLIHGRRAKFSLSWEPGYTYEGRAAVTSLESMPYGGTRLEVEIDASPWRLKQLHTDTFSASGGVRRTCVSGRRPVHPLISCNWPVTVSFEGKEFTVPADQTYRMVDVTFSQGENEIWLSTYSYRTATWADVSGSTWADLSGTPWSRVVVGEEDQGQGVPGDASVTLQWEESYL